ncbi:hypothetical protein KBY66_15115 [Synechococcus sp. Tobar12-5m-g]|nr:hypothetical protein [Synechococcus sp. Tobar12-5m-g]MCP9874902.1 hypothetical protein [Synechococcus sp. Cruz CV-v-12]
MLSGHRYRGANPILLCLGMHLRGSALPCWRGFGEARALGSFLELAGKASGSRVPQERRCKSLIES